MMLLRHSVFSILTLSFLSSLPASPQAFVPSDRQIPVAYEVDLLVLGGTTGAVAAATEAADQGAKVVLVSEYPYLGENLTATLRLWPTENESMDDPLAKTVFNDPSPTREIRSPYFDYLNHADKHVFSYEITGNVISKSKALVSRRLNDGKGEKAATENIQLDDDASIVVDFGETKNVCDIALLAFTRSGKTGFDVRTVRISSSTDKNTWISAGEAIRTSNAMSTDIELERDRLTPFALTLDEPIQTRYLKVDVFKPKNVPRMLLAELVVLPVKLDRKNGERAVSALPRPMHVKRELDRALLEANVPFLYNSYLNAWIRDDNDRIRGAVIANKAGRQAVIAKQILHFPSTYQILRNNPSSLEQVEFVVIGGNPVEVACGKDVYDPIRKATCFPFESPFYGPRHSGPPREADAGQPDIETVPYQLLRYRFDFILPDSFFTPAEKQKFLADLENRIRQATYGPDQAFTSDELYFLSSPRLAMLETPEDGFIRCHPDLPIHEGRKAGRKIVAALSKSKPDVLMENLRVAPLAANTVPAETFSGGDLKEMLHGVRPIDSTERKIKESKCPWPILGEYDVVVVGGGTSGAAAGIGAARNGAKTLVVEHMHTLGGIGTAGAIAVYYYGNRVGFTKEVLDGKTLWRVEEKANWWLTKLRDAGGEAWLGSLAVGAIVENEENDTSRILGIAVATPYGPGVVLAKTVIDSTGNGDMAALAGASMHVVDDTEFALQGAGLPPRNLGAGVTNTDFMYVDENDILDAVHVFVYAKEKYPGAFDQGKLLDTRERRRIVGDFSISVLDEINDRTYPDTIVQCYSNFDSHGYTTDPYMELEHPEKEGVFANVPLRCSLPQGVDALLVSGLATSCHRDALPILRMQADLQNQGYALGYLAARAIKDQASSNSPVDFRKVDIRSIQKHLVRIGNLKESVLSETDNYDSRLKELPDAVKSLADHYQGANIVLWYPQKARPLVHQAYLDAQSPETKLIYAKVAAALGDPVGADVLIDKIVSFKGWDKGWNFRSAGQFGSATSELDQLIMMLGRTRDPKGVPVIVEKMHVLTQKDDFSHQRACFLALEWIGDRSAAQALYEIAKKTGMTGYSHETYDKARHWNTTLPGGTVSIHARRNSLLEIAVARALYRCGDHDGFGEIILKRYAEDRRGHFARHAKEVLKSTVRHD